MNLARSCLHKRRRGLDSRAKGTNKPITTPTASLLSPGGLPSYSRALSTQCCDHGDCCNRTACRIFYMPKRCPSASGKTSRKLETMCTTHCGQKADLSQSRLSQKPFKISTKTMSNSKVQKATKPQLLPPSQSSDARCLFNNGYKCFLRILYHPCTKN